MSLRNELSPPRILQADGTTTENGCVINGDNNICPANTVFESQGLTKILNARIACPLNSVAQSDFREASQKGLCTCDATLQDLLANGDVDPDSIEPLICECFICPSSSAAWGTAYTCNKNIIGACKTFNCNGDCNGDMNFLDQGTRSPTAAPRGAGYGSSAAFGTGTPVATMALLLLVTFRIFR